MSATSRTAASRAPANREASSLTAMNGEPVESGVYVPWQPDPMRQRLADYTLEDVLNLPPDAPRVELADGVMHVVPSPTIDHHDI